MAENFITVLIKFKVDKATKLIVSDGENEEVFLVYINDDKINGELK